MAVKIITKKKTTRITVAQLEKRVIELEKKVIELEKMCKCKPEAEEDVPLEQRVLVLEKWIKAITKK